MDKMEKQLRDVLGSDAVDALEGLVNNELLNAQTRGQLMSEGMKGMMAALPKDIEERLVEASKDAGPRDMVLVVPPGPSRIGRLPDLSRNLGPTVICFMPAEMPTRDMEQRMGMVPTITEAGMELLKKIDPPIAIDVQMNPDGSLSFGVVPPDEDHPPLQELREFGSKIDPMDLYRSIGKVELRPEHKLDPILTQPLDNNKMGNE